MPLAGVPLEGTALAALMAGHCLPGQAVAVLLCLGMTAALVRGCLQCDPNFSEKFSFYSNHLNLKSWWVGDIPVSRVLLSDWSENTMKELRLSIPPEITREKLDQVATVVYRKMDQLYQGKMYYPGYLPNELRDIFWEQVRLIKNSIIESRVNCQRNCGITQFEAISCINCTDTNVVCFGYDCKTSSQWHSAVHDLLNYIQAWTKHAPQPSRKLRQEALKQASWAAKEGRREDMCDQWGLGYLLLPQSLSPSLRCLEQQHLVNLTLENASECLTQH
ncbi:izumo sperm-egg fusion protein 4 [Acomys russatus]|uniref:izumo sperm-egg fusion protein 4 n=1 Tax=Acomys russatus TaxID=60746 RepID=UPI0021E2E731|nr:izumo sperm-egg fusion protein 4 [Acomys russatus]